MKISSKCFTACKNLFRQSKQRINNEKGFNLTELMIASALSGIIAIGASSLYIFIMDNFRVVVEQNAAQESLLWVAYQTRAGIQSAKSFETINVGDSPYSTAEGAGRIVVPSQASLKLVEYYKEHSDGGSGEQRAASISMIYPHRHLDVGNAMAAGAYMTRGLMGRIVLFRTRDNGNNWVATDVDYDDDYANSSFYDRIVQYDRTDNGAQPFHQYDIATRYFIRYTEDPMDWSHVNDTPAVGNFNRFMRDLNMRVVVPLRNLNYNMAIRSGLHGNVYYYRYMAPPILVGVDYNQ